MANECLERDYDASNVPPTGQQCNRCSGLEGVSRVLGVSTMLENFGAVEIRAKVWINLIALHSVRERG
jgi:hypothetical protein